MTRYLLDTNMVSYLVKAHPAVSARVVAVPMASLCISAITEGELLFGLAKRPSAKHLHHIVGEFLRRVDVLPWDSAAARHYGDLRNEMETIGKPIGPLDLLIAAHALSTNAVLVTNDNAFRQVKGLALQDWTK